MRRFVLTGAPGAGKTAILRQLELEGFSVVDEAATDVIAATQAQGTVQPWTHPWFIDAVATLQRDRQLRASCQADEVQFHDRCAVCTAALAVYLGYSVSPFLASELERIRKQAIYQGRIFFVRNLGSSRLPKLGESALRKACGLRKFTNKLIESSASNWSQSSPKLCWSGSALSKRQFVSFRSLQLKKFSRSGSRISRGHSRRRLLPLPPDRIAY
jgi:hypothetical protein